MPERLLRQRIRDTRTELSRRLAQAASAPDARVGPASLAELTSMLRTLLEMTDGKHIQPVIVSPLGGHRVVVRDIRITDGRLTLHFGPADRPRPTTANATRRGG